MCATPTQRLVPRHAVLLACVCAGSLAPAALATQAGETVAFLPRWKAGDKMAFDLVKTRQRVQPGKAPLRVTSRTPLDVEVLNAAEDGFLLAWTSGKTVVDAGPGADQPLAGRLLEQVAGFRLVLQLGPDGAFTGVRNWEEVRDVARKALDTMGAELERSGLDESALAAIRRQAQGMFATKEQVEQHCCKEAQQLLFVLGFELRRGAPLEFDDVLPNPFGGEPFPSRARVALEEVDRARGVARVSWRQTMDPEAARQILEKSLAEVARRMGKPGPEGAGLATVSIEDTGDYLVDLASGWPRQLTHTRATRVDGGSQEDTITITRREP